MMVRWLTRQQTMTPHAWFAWRPVFALKGNQRYLVWWQHVFRVRRSLDGPWHYHLDLI